ncbi:bifunctional phosphoglucose/phosphomannose isomerase [Iamia sp. SCSIO 61187]|uniref:bifunctional phosphoglucose/phosphomannose isomerase n=1 Tax=Iamia sp. SCSIO 61187 TaxID=2722752 RepID=UPI001C633C26|nr:bifunctional phosphoglucose/phosphomannose isomerase [Iamia sp. SCSIO 61187]QYG93939.1 bifunctional phosphoglucose/phosphomannose isomerase [Iamia sp. SCSIO 61187]
MSADTSPTRRGLDSLGMRDATLGLGDQVTAAVAAGEAIEHLPDGEEIANIVVLGMGDSGIVGDIIETVGDLFLPVPVVVVKGYDAPSFVASDTLVVAVSYSGDTDETVQAAEESAASGGRMLVVASGGQLLESAAGWGAAVAPVPDTFPAPRTAVGAMTIPVLVALERMGIFPGAHGWIAATADQLRRRADQLAADRSPAADLARRIGRTLPIVYGAGAVGRVAATRWKTQVNVNAKTPAFANALPELGHNELVGWGQHGDVTRQVFQMVFLRHEEEHPQQGRRFDALQLLLEEVVGGLHMVDAEGEGSLAQLLDLMLFGDMVSLELAAQEGVDPGPTPALDELKRTLSHG